MDKEAFGNIDDELGSIVLEKNILAHNSGPSNDFTIYNN